MTYLSYADQAAEYRRESRRYYSRHRKDARDAARFYEIAAEQQRAAVICGRYSSPEVHESLARSFSGIADTYLRSAFRDYDSSVFYREMAKRYEARAAEQAARLAEIRLSEHEHRYVISLAIPRKLAGAVTGYDSYQECSLCGDRRPTPVLGLDEFETQSERLDEELRINGFGWREAVSLTNEQIMGWPAVAGRFQEAEERRSYRPVYPAPAEPDHARALERGRHDKLVELLGGGGSCAYCHAEVYVAEDARVLAVSEPADSEEADFCPADSGTHHSQPVDTDRLADEIAELACLYASGSCARLGEFEAAVQACLGAM